MKTQRIYYNKNIFEKEFNNQKSKILVQHKQIY